MKFQILNSNDIKVFFSGFISSEEEILNCLEKILKNYKNKLQLSGFYQITIYNRKYGLFFLLHKERDSFHSDTFDYRVLFDDEASIYFQTTDYFAIRNCHFIYYYDEMFYALVDDSFDKLFEKVEFGEFLLECEFNQEDSILINK